MNRTDDFGLKQRQDNFTSVTLLTSNINMCGDKLWNHGSIFLMKMGAFLLSTSTHIRFDVKGHLWTSN